MYNNKQGQTFIVTYLVTFTKYFSILSLSHTIIDSFTSRGKLSQLLHNIDKWIYYLKTELDLTRHTTMQHHFTVIRSITNAFQRLQQKLTSRAKLNDNSTRNCLALTDIK